MCKYRKSPSLIKEGQPILDLLPLLKLCRPLGDRVHEKLVEEGEKEEAKHAGRTDPRRRTVRLDMGGSLGSTKGCRCTL